MMRRLAAALCALVLTASVATAQQLRGVVRDSASRTPAMRRLQVLRIGFRPRVLPIPETVDGIARLDVSMASIPMMLRTVSVIDQPQCPRRPDRAAAFALWEQAKTALLATVVARDASPATVLRMHYDRRIDRDADTTDQIEVRIDSASTAQPFIASRPASEFLERGFVDEKRGFRAYHAPDADVMLDDAFPRGYCFEIAAPDGARPREVGLGFRPALRKRSRVDIEGAVWIDTASRALTDIVFRYVGLEPRYERYRTGGVISFRTMANGSVLIDRWHIRLLFGIAAAEGSTPVVSDVLRALPFEVHERGGEVARARWADGREWLASLGTVAGRAFYGAQPAMHTRFQLLGTDYAVVTDSTGAFKIPHLLPAPYVLGVDDPLMAELGVTLKTGAMFSAVRDSTIRLTVATPTAVDFAMATCTSMKQAAGRYSVIGRILNPDSSEARGAAFEVSRFVGNAFRPIIGGRTDEHGVFVLCSVSLDDKWLVSAHHNGNEGSVVRNITRRIEVINLRLKPPEKK